MLRLGTNVHIGRDAFIKADGGLEIGSNTHLSRAVTIYTFSHNYEGDALPYDETFLYRPVRIGRNVWIGMNVCIAPGTTIGDGAIIGIGAVAHGTIGPGEIVVAGGSQTVRTRDSDRYARLEASGAFGGPDGVPYPLPGGSPQPDPSLRRPTPGGR